MIRISVRLIWRMATRFVVGAVLDRFENKLEIKGAVFREGLYELSDAVHSVKTLIEKAEGITGDAFPEPCRTSQTAR